MSGIEVFMQQFEAAAGRAAVAELRMRMLLNKKDSTKAGSFVSHYKEVIDALITHYEHELSSEEKDLLQKSKQLRNKLLHSEMMQLASLHDEPTAHVRRIEIPDNPTDILKTILGVADGTTPSTNVHDRMGDKDGIFGWFLQNGVSGNFHQCYEVFSEIGEISSRIAMKY